MRCLFGFIAITLIFFSCATTEVTENREEPAEPERVERASPDWFNSSVSSSADSVSFYGYSHAVASDRAEAEELSEEMAAVNLRFEIDRYAEEVRQHLEEEAGNDSFGTSRFIILLRNSIQNLSLDNLNTETDYYDEDGVFDVYTRVSISIERVIDKLSDEISEPRFIAALREGNE